VRCMSERAASVSPLPGTREHRRLAEDFDRALADRTPVPAEPPQGLGDWDPGAPPHDGSKVSSRPPAAPIVLRHISEIVAERREAEWLLHKMLEAFVLAVLAGPRGTFKSFIALHWAMLCALAGHVVVILSAEGAGLDRRADAWMREHGKGVELTELPVLALERPLNLNLTAELAELTAAFEALPKPPALVVVDTLSKFSAGLDENSNFEVAMFLGRLAEAIRDRFKCTVLLVAHSGHTDGKRPRGASVLMANPDAEYIVDRPNPTAMTVTVSRERFKDAPALPPVAYEARLVLLGRADKYGEPVSSLALHGTDTVPDAARSKGVGKNQAAAMTALREWARANGGLDHIPSDQLTALFKVQGIGRQRRPEILNWLANAGVLTQSVAGFVIHREAL
jgi:AAA domain